MNLTISPEARTDARLARQLGGRQPAIIQLLQQIDEADPYRKLNLQSVTKAKPAPMNDGSNVPSANGVVLHVDQVGSLLVLSGDYFSVGTTETRGKPDAVLQTEGQPEAIFIRRSGEDYLAVCGTDFRVDGNLTRQHLLVDGNTIEIGKRGRLTFRRPVAASSTAVLQIKGSKLQRRDIRSIVLMGDALIFGQSGSHFPIASVTNRVMVRPTDAVIAKEDNDFNEFIIHRHGDSSRQFLRAGDPVDVGNCQFSLTPYSRQRSVS